jgi:nucleoside-diphosphate-sugar epimerase
MPSPLLKKILRDFFASHQFPIDRVELKDSAGKKAELFPDRLRDRDLSLFRENGIHTERVGIPTHKSSTSEPKGPGHRLRDDRCYAIDSSFAQRELNWKPRHKFEDGLAETIQWYIDNPAWWQPLLERAERY